MCTDVYLKWWNPVSDPCCPENTFSTGDECVGWSHIKGCLEIFGQIDEAHMLADFAYYTAYVAGPPVRALAVRQLLPCCGVGLWLIVS